MLVSKHWSLAIVAFNPLIATILKLNDINICHVYADGIWKKNHANVQTPNVFTCIVTNSTHVKNAFFETKEKEKWCRQEFW